MISLQQFAGERPVMHAHNLPETHATYARDVYPWSSGLDPLRGVHPVETGWAGFVRVWRVGDKRIGMSEWADFVRSPIVQDKFERVYFTRDAGGLRRTTYGALVHDVEGFDMGAMPWPDVAPGVAVTQQWTAEDDEVFKDASFLITYLTVWDEETAPSVASGLVTYADGTDKVTVTWAVPSADVAKVIVYMAVDGVWLAVAEVPASAGQVVLDPLDDDITPVAGTVIGTELATAEFARAPVGLRGLSRLPNGSLAGFTLDGDGVTSTVHVSVAYQPHAWPLAYRFKIDARVVALATVPEGLLVLTRGNPVLIAGASPDVMDEHVLESYQSCLDRRSVVFVGDAVVWSAPDGIAVYGGRSVKILSEAVWCREQWQALQPSNMLFGLYENHLVIYPQAHYFGLLYSLARHDVVRLSQGGVTAAEYDVEEDALLVVRGDDLAEFGEGEPLLGEWISKAFLVPAARTYNSARLVVEGNVLFSLFRADNDLKQSDDRGLFWSKPIDHQRPFRVGSAGRMRDIRLGFTLSGSKRVRLALLAQDMRELV